MNLLRGIFGKQRRRRNTFNIRDGQPAFVSSLFDSSHWRLTGVTDLSLFFRGLPSLVPKGSILCLAGRTWPNRVQTILDTISLNMESAPPPAANLTLGYEEAYVIFVTAQNMLALGNLSEHSAELEIAMHLSVLSDGERLLEWYDMPCYDPIAIALKIEEDSVSHFANSVGGKYQRITISSNRTFIQG